MSLIALTLLATDGPLSNAKKEIVENVDLKVFKDYKDPKVTKEYQDQRVLTEKRNTPI